MSHRDFRPNRADTAWYLRWYTWAILLIIAMSVIGRTLGWGFSWLSVPGQITSVQNVSAQWQFAYEFDASLKAGARQVCRAQSAVLTAGSDVERTSRRDQLFAYQTNYDRIKGEYDAALANAFKAKWVKPDDVPEQAPSLETNMLRECNTTPMP